MGFWEAFGNIFGLKNLKRFNGILKLLSDNKIENKNDNNTVNINGNVVIVNIGKIEQPNQIQELKKIIRSAVQSDNALIIDEESESLIEEFSSEDEKNRSILEYFKGRIPFSDIAILRAALFLKSQHEAGKNVFRLKDDIVAKYGERGRNISNLCSAGYFDNLIKPLYEDMFARQDFSSEKFKERYDVLVNQYPFAVFVNRTMDPSQVKKAVFKKMSINRSYGIKHLSIHGIGSENVGKINSLLVDEDMKKEFTQHPEIDSGQMFITVTIWF